VFLNDGIIPWKQLKKKGRTSIVTENLSDLLLVLITGARKSLSFLATNQINLLPGRVFSLVPSSQQGSVLSAGYSEIKDS